MKSPPSDPRTSGGHAGGFTLIELLVVITILAILAGMLIPAVSLVKDSAQSLRCANQLRQLGMIMNSYADQSDDSYPPLNAITSNGTPSFNQWYTNLLEAQGVISVNWSYSIGGRYSNKTVGSILSDIWRCPMTTTDQLYWGGGYGILSVPSHGFSTPADAGASNAGAILRGQVKSISSTALMLDCERADDTAHPGLWVTSPTTRCPYCQTWSGTGGRAAARHGRGTKSNVVFMDGRVQVMSFVTLSQDGDDIWRHP